MAERDSTTQEPIEKDTESDLGELLQAAGEDLRDLKGLVSKVRGLAKEIEAGKVPGSRRIKRIASNLARLQNNFGVIVMQLAMLVGKAKREGFLGLGVVVKSPLQEAPELK